MKDIKKARELMNGKCRVCNFCDGKGCVGILPGMGASNENKAFIRNIKDLSQFEFDNNKYFKLSEEEFLDKLAIAPITGVHENIGSFPKEYFSGNIDELHKLKFFNKNTADEYYFLHEYIKGAFNSNIMACIGDGAHEHKFEAGINAINKFKIKSAVFIKPFKQNIIKRKLEKIVKTDVKYIGIDIDAINLINMSSKKNDMEVKTPEHIKELVKLCNKPFVIKGVLDVDTAKSFFGSGAKVIIVSNHGGRVGDLISPISCFKKIKNNFPKKELWFDSGIRSGEDIAKALYLGASKVFIGRPAIISVFCNGFKGVENLIKKYYDEYNNFVIKK